MSDPEEDPTGDADVVPPEADEFSDASGVDDADGDSEAGVDAGADVDADGDRTGDAGPGSGSDRWDGDRRGAGTDPEGEGDGRWPFALDEVDEDGIVRESIEPGRIDPENALFVVLGAAATVLVFVRLALLVS